MTSAKFVEAIVMKNSTCGMQMEAFRRNPSDPVRVAIDLAEQVFRLPKRLRRFHELEKELEGLFISQIRLGSIPAMTIRMANGLSDSAGPKEGLTNALIVSACMSMGLRIPGEREA
ncbi:MAG: hypothetical protein QMD11_10450 [Smithella sp.]|nr:hypothetical protein [Smithella sp.]